MSATIPAASVNDWVNIVRRARLDSATKLIALLLASYANPDGTNVYPGVARLAVQSHQGYRTVVRLLARLRALGLIERVTETRPRRGWKTGYRLTFPDPLDKLDVPTPATEEMAIEAVAARERERVRTYRAKHRKDTVTIRHPDGVTSDGEPVDNPPADDSVIRHPDGVTSDDETPPERRDCNATGNALTSADSPTPSMDPTYKNNPPSGETSRRNGGAGSTRAREANDGDDFEGARRREIDRLAAWMREHEQPFTVGTGAL